MPRLLHVLLLGEWHRTNDCSVSKDLIAFESKCQYKIDKVTFSTTIMILQIKYALYGKFKLITELTKRNRREKKKLLPSFCHFSNLQEVYLFNSSKVCDDAPFLKLQSLPKVLEHLQYFLDYLISTPLSPSKQCWFMEDIHAAHTSIYLQITLMEVSV